MPAAPVLFLLAASAASNVLLGIALLTVLLVPVQS